MASRCNKSQVSECRIATATTMSVETIRRLNRSLYSLAFEIINIRRSVLDYSPCMCNADRANVLIWLSFSANLVCSCRLISISS